MEKETKKALSIDDLLAKTVQRDAIKQNEDLKAATNKSATVQICCTQSGYVAHMTPLKYSEFFKMANTEASNYENRKTVYQTIYSKISKTSIEDWEMKFEDWLKATSVYDIETLCYGIFCATYLNTGTYKFQCPYCGNIIEAKINHNNIQHAADSEKIKELSENVSKHSDSIENLQKYSLILAKETPVVLDSSGIVFALKVPSLYDMLYLLKVFTDEELATIEDRERFMLTILLCTSFVLIPVTGSDSYSKLDSKKSIYGILNSIDAADITQLKTSVIDMIAENHVSYSIKNIKCSHHDCNKEISYVPLNLEEILFAHIANLIS